MILKMWRTTSFTYFKQLCKKPNGFFVKICCWMHWINLFQWKCVSTCVDENSVPVPIFDVINPHPYTNSSNLINSPNLKRETSITSFLSNNMNSYLNTWSWPVLFFLIEVPNQPTEHKKETRKGPKRIISLYFILWQMLLRFDKALIKTNKTAVADLRGGGRRGRTPPPGGQNFFIFMQFSAKIYKIIGWRPPPGSWRPLLGEILDPALNRMYTREGRKLSAVLFSKICTAMITVGPRFWLN